MSPAIAATRDDRDGVGKPGLFSGPGFGEKMPEKVRQEDVHQA